MKRLLALLPALFLLIPTTQAQNGGSLRVFLDCDFFCDDNFIREELPVVDFITERQSADVHILYARQTTGSGGDRITLTFLGQRDYSALSDTLTYATPGDATSDVERRALLHNLSLGLVRYMARAGIGDKLTITAIKPQVTEQPAASIEVDPWNYWSFSIGASGNMNGQETTNFRRRSARFSANRTTEELKVRISGNLNDRRSEFDTGDDTIVNETHNESLFGQVVKSIGEQWAVGGTARLSASSFQNNELETEFGPAIEYDFFPYSESTRRLLTAQYGVRLARRNYEQLTIFGLEEETILRHYLDLSLSLSQKWGSVSVSADISHLLTNFERSLTDSYNLGLFGNARVRLFKGFSFNTFASYNRIRDQLDLPGNAATKEEILLQSIQLPTGYSFNMNFGFTYRFGSIFNNVVNPRFGGGGGSVIFF
ncbi:MAG: hypothetical protein JJ896_00570 [Rhodothermales bacterium]|nr:hypothetical protein [Rhodothermales bacterium]MBO6778120.1 hypothetical protein [Rhodothermales bacterium]